MCLPIILPTTVVGSYPQPDWLVDRELLGSKLVPRLRAREIWRVPEPHLEQAQDDATLLAICDMERAGIDIITDGEMRRESYSNRLATALEGVDNDHPGQVTGRTGKPTIVPRVVGPIRRRGAIEVRDIEFLKKNTDRAAKITLPGPYTRASRPRTNSTPTMRRWRWPSRRSQRGVEGSEARRGRRPSSTNPNCRADRRTRGATA